MSWLINKIVKNLENLFVKTAWLEDLVGQYSLVGNTPFFEIEQFPSLKVLESNWKTIRQELEPILEVVEQLPNYQDISERQANITNDEHWKTYWFYAYGYQARKNCERCPQTTRLLQQVPGLKAAFFSILSPHKHIPEHRGKHKGVIRYHLGLMIPEPKEDCWIKIADKTTYWEEGKSWIFDDTFYHEVQNNTDGYRVILFLDIARPLRFPLSLVNWLANKLIAASPIVQEAKVNHEQWEQKFEATISYIARLNHLCKS